MADAKKKKKYWKERLQQLAVECHWILRESLLAKGAATMMVLEDNKNNKMECKKLVSVCTLRSYLFPLPPSPSPSPSLILTFSLFHSLCPPPSLPPSLPPPPTLQIVQYEKEKRTAAQSGFQPRVMDVTRSIEQYTAARNACEEKIAESTDIIRQIMEELVSLDGRLHTLRPGLKLDTLESRCM